MTFHKTLCLRVLSALLVVSLVACAGETTIQTTKGPITMDVDQMVQLVGGAYLYGYPLVLMDMTRQVSTNVEAPHPTLPFAPVNQLGHFRRFPDHTSKKVVKPNVDTYYSIAWLDLAAEPVVLSMPATDRYYLMPFYDAYSNVIASPGTRTTGTSAQTIVVTGPNWTGTIPEDYLHVASPTEMVWLIGRIQTNSDEDGAKVVKGIQDGMDLRPMSALNDDDYTPTRGEIDDTLMDFIPSEKIKELDALSYLNRLAQLMQKNPPALRDSVIISQLSSIGLEPGKAFEISTDNLILKTKLSALPKYIHAQLDERRANPKIEETTNGWTLVNEKIGEYGIDYRRRAYVGYVGLGANWAEDAIYPVCTFDSNGDRLDASKQYILHFDKDEIPPVKAFWSLTAYNADDFLVENELNRFALGDRDDLQFNLDGSLDLYIQNQAPDTDQLSNWLPIPEHGLFSVVLRLYWPTEAILNGEWKPPYLQPM